MSCYIRYSGDPYWITLKHAGKCRRCGEVLPVGSRAFRYKDGSLYGEECGHGDECHRNFAAAAEDEAFLSRDMEDF